MGLMIINPMFVNKGEKMKKGIKRQIKYTNYLYFYFFNTVMF